MFPRKGEWKAWSALERVNYVAQFLVPISLLVTVVFSFLSWKEARRSVELNRSALQQERAFFVAQNPPQLDLTGLQVLDSAVGPIIFFTLKNTGDAALRSPCTTISRISEQGSQTSVVSSNCGVNDGYQNATIRKGESLTYHVPVKGYFKAKPTDWKVLNPAEANAFKCKGPVGDALLVHLNFKDVAGEQYTTVRQVILCN